MQTDTSTPVVIAVGRQFGSGGREFGRRLAAALHIGYYDKELLRAAADNAGLCREIFESRDEQPPGFCAGLCSFSMGYVPNSIYAGTSVIGDDKIYSAQSDFIRSIASRESCVIVGRTADYVLRDTGRVVSIFVHAPMEACVARIISRNPEVTAARARHEAERVNKLRAGYYNFFTDRTWGAASTYDLCLDTSQMPMNDLVSVAVRYITLRFPGFFSVQG